MTKYLMSRLGWGAVIVLCILVLNFLIIHAVPGDPLQAMLGDFPVPVEYAAKIRTEFGLDLPIWTQLVLYLKFTVPPSAASAVNAPPTATFPANQNASGGRFSWQQWQHHREYNALMGAGAIYLALAVRLFLHHRGVLESLR